MTIDAEGFRATMRCWMSGVTIVGTHADSFGEPRGMTVSSFTSVSMEPPLVLVCLFKDTETSQSVIESQVFGVSILGLDHADISSRFAGIDPDYPEEANRFDGLETITLETNAPLLKDAIAHLDCRVREIHDGATHFIVIGEVVASQINNSHVNPNPLVYGNQGYHRLMAWNDESE